MKTEDRRNVQHIKFNYNTITSEFTIKIFSDKKGGILLDEKTIVLPVENDYKKNEEFTIAELNKMLPEGKYAGNLPVIRNKIRGVLDVDNE